MMIKHAIFSLAFLSALPCAAQDLTPPALIERFENHARDLGRIDASAEFSSYDRSTSMVQFSDGSFARIIVPPAEFGTDALFDTGIELLLQAQREDVEGTLRAFEMARNELTAQGFDPNRIVYRPDLAADFFKDQPTYRHTDWVVVNPNIDVLASVGDRGDVVVAQQVKTVLTSDAYLNAVKQVKVPEVVEENTTLTCEPDCFLETVAIIVNGSDRGSGVMIADNLVVTAEHVLRRVGAGYGDFPKTQVIVRQGPAGGDRYRAEEIIWVAPYDLAIIQTRKVTFTDPNAAEELTSPLLNPDTALKNLGRHLIYSPGYGAGLRISAEGEILEDLPVGDLRYNSFTQDECEDCAAHEVGLTVLKNLDDSQDFSCGADSGSPALLRVGSQGKLAVVGILTESINEPVGGRRCAYQIKFQDLTDPDVASALRLALVELTQDSALVDGLYTDDQPGTPQGDIFMLSGLSQ